MAQSVPLTDIAGAHDSALVVWMMIVARPYIYLQILKYQMLSRTIYLHGNLYLAFDYLRKPFPIAILWTAN